MKKYENLVGELNLFTDLNDAAVARLVKELNAIAQIREQYHEEFEGNVASVRNLASNAKNQCDTEKNRRERFARNAVTDLQRIMSEIKDQHFYRMEEKYTLDARDRHINVSDFQADDLMQKAREELLFLRACIGKLNQAFLPAGVSNVIGAVIPAYRKRKFKQIVESRNKVLDYIEPLLDISEFESFKAEVDEVCENRIAEENTYLEQRLAIFPELGLQKKQLVLEYYNHGLALFEEQTGLFDYEEHQILYGIYTYRTNYLFLFAETDLGKNATNVMEDATLSLPVMLDTLQDNYFYLCSGNNQMARHFSAISLELLMTNDDSEMIFIDVKGLGSEYAVFNKLTPMEHVSIWSTSLQVSSGLDELESWISSVYSENLADRYGSLSEYNASHERKKPEKYIFINDLKSNIEKKDFEKFIRIVKSGRKAGVYVIAASPLDDLSDRRFSEMFGEIQLEMQVIAVENMSVKLKENALIRLNAKIERNKLDTVFSLLRGKKEQGEIIPLEKYLPQSDEWHTLRADKEIVIPFGIDSNGKVAVLRISSEKPYTMIIGDPRHGKSKLMHTIIMMATSRYSEDEVKIAVMDLKDGAEFNVYAKAGLRSVECVVNDEDPDAMLSFLKYYVAQMHSRQELFEKMEEATGVIIQKYEDYRATNASFNNVMPEMPRLVLLIDEFQTLFDGAASSLFMSELVRKGATYGIHVVLSSQRALSSNPRNGFTADLKDYFTSRFVFKCPQSAAKTVLSDRCADTGRENSGIHKAALLGKGHVIYNSYMGQTEADNVDVQCFYPSTELVAQFVQVLEKIKGGAPKILLRKNAKSIYNSLPADGSVHIGNSVRLHHDLATGSEDYIRDDMTVSFSMESVLKNMIVTGTDVRVVDSLIGAIKHFSDTNAEYVLLNILGSAEKLKEVKESSYFKVKVYAGIDFQMRALEECANLDGESYVVNLLVEPDLYEEYAQSLGGLRKSSGVEMLKSVLSKKQKMFSILYSKSFKNLRNSMQYVISESPVHIVSVGDYENVRMSMSENIHLIAGDFDVPKKDSIKAYYYNKDTEKYGKIIMYRGELSAESSEALLQ